MLDASLIQINSYEFQLKPFAYRLNFEGRLEISSRYRFGAKLLTGKAHLPNQTVDLIDIIPDYRDRCRNRDRNCRVFRFKTFIQLSGDRYFSREFDSPENIPIKFALDFNSNNLDSFKAYNPFFKDHAGGDHKHQRFSDLIAAIKLLEINAYFRYQNSFNIERSGGYQDRFRVQIPVSWTISNGLHNADYESVWVRVKNYDLISDYYIKDWFSIQSQGYAKVDQSFVSFRNGSILNLPLQEISRSYYYDWISFSLRGTIKKEGGEYKYEQDYRNSGIFFASPTAGVLNTRVHLLLNNHGYYINIKNPFSFVGQYWSSLDSFITVWIQNKSDHLFRDLKKFRFLSL